jgi:hypothetical protein
LGSIVDFAVFVAATLVAVPFVVAGSDTAALVAADTFAVGSTLGGTAAVEPVGVFEFAAVTARRRRAGFDSSAWAAASCAATAFATFVASR